VHDDAEIAARHYEAAEHESEQQHHANDLEHEMSPPPLFAIGAEDRG
jgi:hypothetical protein